MKIEFIGTYQGFDIWNRGGSFCAEAFNGRYCEIFFRGESLSAVENEIDKEA